MSKEDVYNFFSDPNSSKFEDLFNDLNNDFTTYVIERKFDHYILRHLDIATDTKIKFNNQNLIKRVKLNFMFYYCKVFEQAGFVIDLNLEEKVIIIKQSDNINIFTKQFLKKNNINEKSKENEIKFHTNIQMLLSRLLATIYLFIGSEFILEVLNLIVNDYKKIENSTINDLITLCDFLREEFGLVHFFRKMNVLNCQYEKNENGVIFCIIHENYVKTTFTKDTEKNCYARLVLNA